MDEELLEQLVQNTIESGQVFSPDEETAAKQNTAGLRAPRPAGCDRARCRAYRAPRAPRHGPARSFAQSAAPCSEAASTRRAPADAPPAF